MAKGEMKLYTNKWIVYGFLTAFLILLGLGYYSFKNNRDIINAREAIFLSNSILKEIEQIQSHAIRVEELLSKYIISGNDDYVDRYKAELKLASKDYSNLSKLINDNPIQLALLDSFRLSGKKKLTLHDRIIEHVERPGQEQVTIIMSAENTALSDKIYAAIDAMRTVENELLRARIDKSRQEIMGFQQVFLMLMLATLGSVAGVFLLVNSSFKSQLMAEEKTKLVNQELEAFTYSVSHDLRAPLRSIRGFTEVLRDEFGPTMNEEGNRLLGIVMKNASRMGQLIDDLLDFSRMGRKALTYSNIDTQQLVEEVKQELAVNVQREVSWEIASLPNIRGDFSMIKQVWINLISNALKYSVNTPVTKVQIGAHEEGGNIVYSVKDNGVGFDEKYSDKLFKVFQRLHNAKEFEGTGVGLALVHRIISKHNGKIWASAKPNEGATFFFYLRNPTL